MTRSYPVQPTILDLCRSVNDPPPGPDPCALPTNMSAERVSVELQEVLVRTGVPFPEGSSVHYSVSAGMLIVKNTESNHEILNSVLFVPSMWPSQVEVVVMTYRLDGESPLPLRIGDRLTAQLLAAIPSNSLTRVAGISLITQSAQNSESAKGQYSLTATPTVGPDDRTIDVLFRYTSGGQSASSTRITSQVHIFDGETLVLQCVPGSNGVEFTTLTANLVRGNGEMLGERTHLK